MKRARASSYRVRSIQKSGFSKTVSKRLVLVVRRSSSNGPVSCRLVSVYSRARRVASASAFGNAPGAARVASPRPDAFFFSASFRVFSATRLRPRPRTDAKTQSVAGDARRSARCAPRAGVPHGVAEPRGHREPRRVPVLPAEQHAVAPAHQPAPGAQLDVLFERRNRPGFRHA